MSRASRRPGLAALARASVLGLVALFPLAAAAPPPPPPHHPPGTSEVGRFDLEGSSAVNLFNGNLSYHHDLGPSYPVDARLEYRFRLSYNSTIWDFSPGSEHGEPVALANAGLGFDLSFGRLLEPGTAANASTRWIYVEPDGGRHVFYSDLHWDTPDAADSSDAVRYTRDSSYLRWRRIHASKVEVDAPDGTRRTFIEASGEWRLSEIAALDDSHWIRFAYSASGDQWTVTDSHGRQHDVFFTSDPQGVYPRLLDRVEMAAFGGARATYTFAYASIATRRACSDPRSGVLAVPVLGSITDPVGQVRSFSYYDAEDGCDASGRLERAQLEAGGFLRWEYGAYDFPAAECAAASPDYLTTGSGVVARQKVWENGTVLGHWSIDPQSTAGGACGQSSRTTTVTTPLGDRHVSYFSVGNDEAATSSPAFYGLPIDGGVADPSTRTSGLQLAREIYDCDVGGGGCTLMRSFYEEWQQDELCQDWAGRCVDTHRRLVAEKEIFHDDTQVDGADRFRQVVRSGYDGFGNFRHEVATSNFGAADSFTTYRAFNPGFGAYPPSGGPGLGGGTSFQAPAASWPWFLGAYAQSVETDADGDSAILDACFDADGFLVRTRRRGPALAASDVIETTTWLGGQAAAKATYGGDLQPIATAADLCTLALPQVPAFSKTIGWAYGAMASVRHAADGLALPYLSTDRDIDLDTGLVARDRSPSGLVTDSLYDLLGRRTWIRPEAGQGAWVQMKYRLPQSGATDGWGGPRVTTIHRENGQTTGHLAHELRQLDPFGRLFLEVRHHTETEVERRRHEWNALDWKTRESAPYRAGEGLHYRQFLGHDPLGRVGTVVPPEGSHHEIVYAYLGDRETRISEQTELAYANTTCYETPLLTTRIRDGQGRDWIETVEQALPQPGAVGRTETRYAVNGIPTRRERVETVGTAVTTQIDEWSVDARGFITSSIARLGNQTPTVRESRTFADFDARGHHRLETVHGARYPAAGLATRLDYDARGRLIEVADAADASRLWKIFEYGDAAGAADASGQVDARADRLTRAVRYNYLDDLPSHTVTETFTYRGPGGRLTEKSTEVETIRLGVGNYHVHKRYETAGAYDALARIVRLDYPRCVLGCSTGEPTALRRVEPAFNEAGQLTAIAGSWDGEPQPWVTRIDWHGTRGFERLEHANGVIEHYGEGEFGSVKPSSLEIVIDGSVAHDFSPLVYDGRRDLCGHGETATISPLDEVELDLEASLDCEDAFVVDPFGLGNGRVRDFSCGLWQGERPYLLYDAFDRPFASLDLSTRKRVYDQNGEGSWVLDPANMTFVYRLSGIDGSMLREVQDHWQGEWRKTIDNVYGLGKRLGEAVLTPTSDLQLHKHPMAVRHTSQYGLPGPVQ